MDELLEHSLTKRNDQLHALLRALFADLNKIAAGYDNSKSPSTKTTVAKVKSLVQEFEPSPKLLDAHLDFYVSLLCLMYLAQNTCLRPDISEICYQFAKVRGFKTVANYFPSDVYRFTELVNLLKKEDHQENDQVHDFETFFVLIWLSNLVLVPFPLDGINSELYDNLFKIALKHLTSSSNASKTQLVSLILMSRLVTRADVGSGLHDYIHNTIVPQWLFSSDDTDQNLKLGHMMTINKILKRTSDIDHETIYAQLMEPEIISLRIQMERPKRPKLNNLNVLYMIKILSKIARIHLQKKNYNRVSIIINNLLNDIMNPMLSTFDTALRFALAKNLSSIVLQLSLQAVNYQEQVIWYMMKQLDIPNLELGPFTTNLHVPANEISISKYHTVLLFLGYVVLNRCLPQKFVPTILSICHKTMFVVQKRLNSTLGNQVRDSTCFILWALCRVLKPDVEDLMMETILFDLIRLTIFDHELIIRRCGIAVIQEYVGRLGHTLFYHLLVSPSPENLGKFTIKFVELFSNPSIGTLNLSYLLIEQLVDMGFSRLLFVPLLLENLLDNTSFAVKKLSSNHLVSILDRESQKLIEFNLGQSDISPQKVCDILLQHVADSGPLYALAELLLLVPEVEPKLSESMARFKFDFHTDSAAKGESYLKWVNSCLSNNYELSLEKVWPNLFGISRLQYEKDLVTEFKMFFQLLEQRNISISFESFNRLVYYVKNNNLIIAKSLVYYKFTNDNFSEILKLVENTGIDCDTRSLTISGLSDNLFHYDLSPAFLVRLVHMLDDYTVTKQGDVGSKIRLATIHLIRTNTKRFLETSTINQLENKLIRLAGESMDRIRAEAFDLLMEINRDEKHLDQNYYRTLLHFYHRHILFKIISHDKYLDHYKNLSSSFWTGLVFSIGSMTGSSTSINQSFLEVLQLLDRLNDQCKLYIFSDLVRLLKMPPGVTLAQLNPRQSKVFMMVLNTFVKLFEAAVPFPPDFNYNALYVRCYNLQVGTSNITRMGLVLKVFQHLATMESDVQLQARKKVVLLSCTHPLAKVRNMASEVLFEIINEIDPKHEIVDLVDSIDWDQPPAQLKKYLPQLTRSYKCR